jgi:hypothetical protein
MSLGVLVETGGRQETIGIASRLGTCQGPSGVRSAAQGSATGLERKQTFAPVHGLIGFGTWYGVVSNRSVNCQNRIPDGRHHAYS